MKLLSVNNVFLFFCLLIGCTAKSQQNNYKTTFLNECGEAYKKKNYSITKKQEIGSNQLEKNPFTVKFKNDGMSNATLLVFTSNKTLKSNSKLGFKVVIYQYKSANDAASKFKEIEEVKKSQDESILSKDWDFLLLYKNFIVRLDATCMYSNEAWKNIRDEFAKIKSKTMGKSTGDTIECECGGNCK